VANKYPNRLLERSGEWEPVDPKIVVEVAYDHFTGGRFRHGTKILCWRRDKHCQSNAASIKSSTAKANRSRCCNPFLSFRAESRNLLLLKMRDVSTSLDMTAAEKRGALHHSEFNSKLILTS
jgi:hypothetical protein